MTSSLVGSEMCIRDSALVYLDVGGEEVKLQYSCPDPAFQARPGQPVLLHRCQKAEADDNAGLLL
eukprot:3071446-Prorocentrum_lima.AAC.1